MTEPPRHPLLAFKKHQYFLKHQWHFLKYQLLFPNFQNFRTKIISDENIWPMSFSLLCLIGSVDYKYNNKKRKEKDNKKRKQNEQYRKSRYPKTIYWYKPPLEIVHITCNKDTISKLNLEYQERSSADWKVLEDILRIVHHGKVGQDISVGWMESVSRVLLVFWESNMTSPGELICHKSLHRTGHGKMTPGAWMDVSFD